MKCENEFCIYQENDECVLEEVSLDIIGQCTECIYVDLNKEVLISEKEKLRKRLSER